MSDRDDRETGRQRAGARGELERGRECYRRRAWAQAYDALSRADRAAALGADDLERLAIAAYLLGRDDENLQALDRAHHAHVEAGASARAIRCAFWLGLQLLFRGEVGRATAWLARAQRLLEREQGDSVEQGYLLIPAAEQRRAAGDIEGAYERAARAAEIGERHRDADLTACARHLQGRLLVGRGEVAHGLALLDEAMLAVTSGELSPLMTGLVYCSVIACCQQVYAVSRAREWTSALARWCEAQPDMVAFTGACLVHRAEIMQWHGEWNGALAEARRACERTAQAPGLRPPAAAFYQQAEVHRLRGDFGAAEAAYREASRLGCEPQPGLARLRLAQGRHEQAVASIRRVLNATTDPLARTHLLPAYIDIMLAAGELAAARPACDELERAACGDENRVLDALAAHARGALALAADDADAAAAVALRRAWQAWQEVGAPYEAARSRVLMGLACRAAGDEDGGRLELEAARAAFEQLGAAPDVARVDALLGKSTARSPLTARELQVLRLVAAGKTNKAIAAELHLSEKTIDRHLSNILTKLDVPSRAAATAYAYRHQLI